MPSLLGTPLKLPHKAIFQGCSHEPWNFKGDGIPYSSGDVYEQIAFGSHNDSMDLSPRWSFLESTFQLHTGSYVPGSLNSRSLTRP